MKADSISAGKVELFRMAVLLRAVLRGMFLSAIIGIFSASAHGGQITVSGQKKQYIRLGVDAERLLYWRPELAAELAQIAVGDMNSEYARVAINCGYEREEGVKTPAAYDEILALMTSFRNANPDIKFFGSPRPLDEAYTTEEITQIWGVDSCPWSPYPSWILTYTNDGTTLPPEKTNWKEATLHVDKLTQYLADYLNFMHENGFEIHYLDIINEKQFVTPAHVAYVSANLRGLLNPGVKMPLLIAPSGWSLAQSANWIKTADPDTYDIAGAHDTGGAKTPEIFAPEAIARGKEAWNTELHQFWGNCVGDEVLSSIGLWNHLRAGFTGIDTWLFFGGGSGHGSAMVWSGPGIIHNTAAKYLIFKKLVNTANGGHYVETVSTDTNIVAAAFSNENMITVWALNSSTNSAENTGVVLSGLDITGKPVEVSRWYGGYTNHMKEKALYTAQKAAVVTGFVGDAGSFVYTLHERSLYCFKVDLMDVQTLPYTESFEGGLAAWWQSGKDEADWLVHNGSFPVHGSGPSAASAGSRYLCMNPSGTGQSAVVKCRFDFTSAPSPFLRFNYHMYGEDTGMLAVDVYEENTSWHKNLWNRTGAQQTSPDDFWQTAIVDLSAFAGRSDVWVHFRAQSASATSGGIAIDHIRLENAIRGVPLSWLAGYGLSLDVSGVLSDTDGDGALAWQEYEAGTDPLASRSVFRLDRIGADGTLHWPAVTGRVYSVYWTSNLVSGAWMPAGESSGGTFTETACRMPYSGYYRLSVRKQ